jgi:hypothetical protein
MNAPNKAGRGAAPTTGFNSDEYLSGETIVYLRRAAAARGLSMHTLGQQLMETIARDQMVDAIIDDGVTTPKI